MAALDSMDARPATVATAHLKKQLLRGEYSTNPVAVMNQTAKS